MRTVRILICLALCALLLTACDLRNRQDSQQFIPDSLPQTDVGSPTRQFRDPQPDTWYYDPGEAGTDSRIRVILEEQGTFRYAVTPIAYSYRIPMLDLPGAQASGVNGEISERFEIPVRASLEAMEEDREPEIASVGFDSYEHSGILTLYLTRRDVDGSFYEAYYTVNGATGERVSAKELLRAAGLDDSNPQEVFAEALKRCFSDRFSRSFSSSDERYTTALTQTLSQVAGFSESCLHLTREGRLVAAVQLFSPGGGSEWIELTLPG